MFKHLAKTALNKLANHLEASINNANAGSSTAKKAAEFPTLPFPPSPPYGPGTSRICPRCLTLLYHVVFAYGDGSACSELEMTHSASMAFLSSKTCVICARKELLFNGMRQHVSFEETLRDSPSKDWRLTWKLDNPESISWYAFHKQAARVSFMVSHKGGYRWGIGEFILHPSPSTPIPNLPASDRKPLPPDPYGTILPLDSPSPAFNSTLSRETLSAVASWMQTCHSSHKKCAQLFPGPQTQTQTHWQAHPAQTWFPDRLIRITRTDNPDPDHWLHTRLVLKSDASDFPAGAGSSDIQYLSFSHCWGPPPDGGRESSTLTSKSLGPWREHLPLATLPRAFRDAVRVCAALGFDHVWIDSLCIMQDSVEDWQEQSAVMADVYKYAWLNIAALSTASDEEGFIREGDGRVWDLGQGREPRVAFGWRAELGGILGVPSGTAAAGGGYQGGQQGRYQQPAKPLVLLQGETTLLWGKGQEFPGQGDWQAPLFTRAWVHQERSLARRTLAFATYSVSFACDEESYAENGDILPPMSNPSHGPRHLRHKMDEAVEKLSAEALATYQAPTRERIEEEAKSMLRLFGGVWGAEVASYTDCDLTRSTDRLIAISSIARELDNSGILQGKGYLAGLWDVNLVSQLGWMTCEGRKAAPRERVGSEKYVAPSWSWASIEAPVRPNVDLCPDDPRGKALAEVLGAEVELATSFAFGPVKAGWMRIRGWLRAVSASETKPNYDYEGSSISTSITDAMTGEKLWFTPDTAEGVDIVSSRVGLRRVVWMPHLFHADRGGVECHVLVFEELSPGESFGGGDFVRPGERVFRRIGSGNFGRVPDLFRQDKLLMSLGTFPPGDNMDLLTPGFVRNVAWDQTFVVV